MDNDGTFSIKFVQRAEKEDIEDALADCRKAQLKAICLAKAIKVPLTAFLYIFFNISDHWQKKQIGRTNCEDDAGVEDGQVDLAKDTN